MVQKLLTFTLLLVVLAVLMGCSTDQNPVSTEASSTNFNAVAQAVPADAVIDSAFFYLYSNTADTQSVVINKVTQSWDQSDVTYNSFAGGFDAVPLTSILVDDTGWYAVDISSQAQAWFDSTEENYGFFLQPSETDTGLVTQFTSLEDSANKPYLTVYYTTFEGPSTETLGASGDASISSASPDMNYGTDLRLTVASEIDIDTVYQVYQSLVQFSFPVEIRYASISDMVWMDENGNGIQDEGEMGMSGVTVNLYDCDTLMLASTITDDSGYYKFEMLMAGDYSLEFVAPENYLYSPMDVGGDDDVDSDVDSTGMTTCITTMPGVDYTNIDAGLYPAPASLGDFVWMDENMNGMQDEGEMGIADIEVHLYTCDGTWLASTTTDSSGMYMFDNLSSGEYYLEFVNPFGYIFTMKDAGDDDELDSDVDQYTKRTDCFTLEQGMEYTGWDAGLYMFDGCTYGKGYWKNHAGFGPQADVVTMLLPIWLGTDDGTKSMAVTDAQIAVDILQQHEYGHPSNGITKLYAHLLTAKLNIMNFANPEDIHETISEIDAFLADYDWNDWDMLSKDDQKMVLKWKDMLEKYNEGDIGPGSCDDDDDHYDDGDDRDGDHDDYDDDDDDYDDDDDHDDGDDDK